MKKIAAHWQILIAIGLAVVVGLSLKSVGKTADGETAYWVAKVVEICKLLGDLFKGALMMIIVPLIVSSIIAGIASLAGFDGFKRLGLKTVSFYLLTTLSAVVLGLFIVNTMKPGTKDGEANTRLQEVFAEQQAANQDVKDRFTTDKQEEAKDWKNIFRPGFSTKKAGWGLGLPLSSRIIEDIHGGQLKVFESSNEVGTILEISL